MHVALVTTTINVPRVLALYRQLGPEVTMFIAGDLKTPEEAYEARENYFPLAPYDQKKWKCSELIGWNCVERRNIALLEAIKWGAEVIHSLDDDNIPIDQNYFDRKFWGCVEASSGFSGWFDPGTLLVPQTKHRGFPIGIKSDPVFEPVTETRIGVAQGLCLGDPDIDAVTRIALAPIIHSVSELGRAGVVTNPRRTKTVFNTQNTSFVRELAPAMFQPPGVGRYSDIYASLICQRVMAERGLYVHFGQPFVWQQRNRHNLIDDLRQEIKGMENVERFATMLEHLQFNGQNNMIEDLRHVWANCAAEFEYIPAFACQAATAFLDDMETVL